MGGIPASESDSIRPDSAVSGSDGLSEEGRIEKRIWRLRSEQLNHEVERLFGTGAPAFAIPDSASEGGISNLAKNATVNLGNMDAFEDGARAIGEWVAQGAGKTTRCAQYGQPACATSFLAWLGPSAYRRELTAQEGDQLRDLFEDLEREFGFDFAISGLVRAVLLSPDFLYRTELGSEAESEQLAGYEIASLLAFSLTDRGPDEALLQAGETGELVSSDGREAHARRLMDQAAPLWQRFLWQWLGLSTLQSQGEEIGLPSEVVLGMEDEFRAFVRQVATGKQGSLRELLSAEYSYASPALAAHYGVDHPGSGLTRVPLNPERRAGLLTQGAWLVSHGKRGRDNVVRRGMNLYRQAMCNNALSRPPDLDVEAEQQALVGADASVLEVVEARGADGTCGACHRMPDPMGMVFETFASDGRWQETYSNGEPVHSAISVEGLGDFRRASDFSRALVDDARFQDCFVRRFTQSFVGVDLGRASGNTWAAEGLARFQTTDTALAELIVALVRHPSFIQRSEEDTQ